MGIDDHMTFGFSQLDCRLIECVTLQAIAETVGSVMSNHIGKGRYLNPNNFNKEITLEFNLGPQVREFVIKFSYISSAN